MYFGYVCYSPYVSVLLPQTFMILYPFGPLTPPLSRCDGWNVSTSQACIYSHLSHYIYLSNPACYLHSTCRSGWNLFYHHRRTNSFIPFYWIPHINLFLPPLSVKHSTSTSLYSFLSHFMQPLLGTAMH